MLLFAIDGHHAATTTQQPAAAHATKSEFVILTPVKLREVEEVVERSNDDDVSDSVKKESSESSSHMSYPRAVPPGHSMGAHNTKVKKKSRKARRVSQPEI